MKNLNYLMDHILYQILKINLNIYLKKQAEKTVKPSIRIHIKRIENRITFIIKSWNHLEILTSETIKLLESAKKNKNEYGVSVPYFYIKCNSYQESSRFFYAFVPDNFFGQLLSASLKYFMFL